MKQPRGKNITPPKKTSKTKPISQNKTNKKKPHTHKKKQQRRTKDGEDDKSDKNHIGMEKREKPPREFLVAKYPSFQLNWGHSHRGGAISQDEKTKDWESIKELRKKVVTSTTNLAQ